MAHQIYVTEMTITEFTATERKHFVALEYHWLILNQTFLVLLTDDALLGLKVNGVVSVEGGRNVLTREITHAMAIQGDLTNPYSYIKNSYAAKYEKLDVGSESILTIDKSNFQISYKDIASVSFDKSKKWGMGYYPHDGKVLVTTKDGRKREFVILGSQSGETICHDIAQTAGC